jgi:hypothetical protein
MEYKKNINVATSNISDMVWLDLFGDYFVPQLQPAITV